MNDSLQTGNIVIWIIILLAVAFIGYTALQAEEMMTKIEEQKTQASVSN